MGSRHAASCVASGNKIGFVYDIDARRATEFANEFGTDQVASTLEDIRWDCTDAVIIASPPAVRGPIELAAIRARVPLFVEKPVGVNASQVKEVVRVLRETPVINGVGYMNRYRTSVRLVKDALQGKSVVAVSGYWIAAKYQKSWWFDRNQSGGPFNDLCTHFVDLARLFGGEILSVLALGKPIGNEDTVGVVMELAGGGVGTLISSCEASEKSISLAIVHREGSETLQGYDLKYGEVHHASSDVFQAEIDAFLNAVELGDQSLVASSFEDACKTQLAVDAVNRSLQANSKVDVQELDALLRI